MNNDSQVKRSLFGIGNYLVYFLSSALIVTVSTSLIYQAQPQDTDQLRRRAILTLIAILALALVMTLLNGLWRRYTIGRPVKAILHATEQLTKGDFDVRIEPFHGFESINELDAIISNFNIMAAELGSVEALQSDFIANISHELKTPLAVIQNYSTMLQDSKLDAETRQIYTKKIIASTQKFSVLITNMMKLNKLENQLIIPKRDNFLLNEQLAAVLVEFEGLWEGKGIDIDVDMPDLRITSDRALLALVWNNLIANAIKFSQQGDKITVSLTPSAANRVTVTIQDTGAGMSDTVQQHIFDKFYQGDKAHAAKGNGLGLALVSRVVKMLAGQIEVTSQLGVGSTFKVTLPVK
ncbi:two component sensor transduction histidine kinase [Agrilactobacillus composti DSM 18527 = JCM 14202]|uniref:histidine kinase n=1 Tax=Agrilactobacillus composti DSM 18527 = JCM 14202 TaxID=1423734 RepID=X0PCQ5_9LACO|nr:HAMP domain-containing sensor histidine kinase [Agrilactobacillus composti]KRM30587.1 two component sensor transduction histidine kinase [Agrilactobacillus composti DSM 18527 = JCM 14202]GAF38338.1 sensor histidine kinase [Agrilactobacillus composti DSM 18527 = JCM 14202]